MNMEAEIVTATDMHAQARPTNIDLGTNTLAEFAARAEAVGNALDTLIEVADKGGVKGAEKLKARLDAFEPCVTVLGQVKSGKTTLINAMAGWPDLLPSDVNPWTSVVTSLHLTPGSGRNHSGARFEFLTEDEWDSLMTKGGRMGELAGRAGAESELEKLGKQIEMIREKSRNRLGKNFELLMGQTHEYGYFDSNLLERYICLGDDFDLEGDAAQGEDEQGRFADVTRAADLFLNSQTLPFRMCLRDTPGVNDTFMMREQITIKAIRDSRICLVVLSAGQALTTVDMGLIRLISNLKSREVIFFVNRIDELDDPANQVTEIENSIRETLLKHHGPHDADIIFGSAYWANKALTGDIEDMSDHSAEVLVDWGRARLEVSDTNLTPKNMVWELSGMPAILRAISKRVVENLGEPLLADIASSAVKIATGQEAIQGIRVQGHDGEPDLTPDQVWHVFRDIQRTRMEALEQALDERIHDYQTRADRSHATFVNRATHSLVDHLKTWGDDMVWEYDPSGLRILLRSAYALLSSRTQATAREQYELAVQEVAELLYRGFGSAVEGMQIGIPPVPEAPPPVVLGQMIALDFNDGWWVSWWRRKRGYEAFANQFSKLISSETEQFMSLVKHDQTSEIRARILGRLQMEFEEYEGIIEDMVEILESGSGESFEVSNEEQNLTQQRLASSLATLREFTP